MTGMDSDTLQEFVNYFYENKFDSRKANLLDMVIKHFKKLVKFDFICYVVR